MLVRVMIAKSIISSFCMQQLCRLCAHMNRLCNRMMVPYNRLLFPFLCQSQQGSSFLVYSVFFILFLLIYAKQTLQTTLERLGIDGGIEIGIFSFIVVYERTRRGGGWTGFFLFAVIS